MRRRSRPTRRVKMSFIIAYITHKNIEEARKIGEHLLKKKIVACVNYFPIDSAYWWKGKIKISKKEIFKSVEIPPSSELGDYSFPCFFLSLILKKNPKVVAAEIKNKLG